MYKKPKHFRSVHLLKRKGGNLSIEEAIFKNIKAEVILVGIQMFREPARDSNEWVKPKNLL